MKRNMFTIVLLVTAGTFLLFGCKKEGVVEETPEPQPQAEIPVPPGMPPQGDPSITPPPQREVLDEEVTSRWKAVEITVQEKKEEGAQSFVVEIPLGGEAAVEGTPLMVKVISFVPDFSMGADTITTKSLEDVNPAAKIEVTEGESVLFTGWSFRDFPGMHSFNDPRYTLQLTKAVPRE